MDVVLFWSALGIIVYTYVGYGALMGLLARRAQPVASLPDDFTPPVVMLVPAHNEAAVIRDKVANCLAQDYPRERLRLLFVNDGSTDGTAEYLRSVPEIEVLDISPRGGKPSALNRAFAHLAATTPNLEKTIVVLSDANSMLNAQAVRRLVRHFARPEVGCVAGEKRVQHSGQVTGAGESLYWRYESTIKRWESQVGDVMGAAGELFAIRPHLFVPLRPDTFMDDFMISMTIAMQGYRLVYEPDAYSLEQGSASARDEWKRKLRISGVGIQPISRLLPLLNPLRYGFLTFQYISHRVLRWTLTPVLLLLILPLNAWLAWRLGGLYQSLLGCQLLFYAAAWAGHKQEQRGARWRPLYVPYYFTLMNLAVFAGAWRYLAGRQDIRWERVQRLREQPSPTAQDASEFTDKTDLSR